MSPTGHKDIAPTRGLRGARHAVRHDRRVRRILGIVRAYSYRPRAVHRRVDARRKTRVRLDRVCALHRRRPPAVQFGNQPISRKVAANLFGATDSLLLAGVNNRRQSDALMRAIGCAEVLDDPRFADRFQRAANETP